MCSSQTLAEDIMDDFLEELETASDVGTDKPLCLKILSQKWNGLEPQCKNYMWSQGVIVICHNGGVKPHHFPRNVCPVSVETEP